MVEPPRQAESALLVPVLEAEPLVGTWRMRYTLDAPNGVPAHVTVLAPFVPPSELTPEIEADLKTLFAAVAPFRFRLVRVASFPNGVLYLALEPEEPLRELTRLVAARYPQFQPYGGAFRDVVPHMTVVDCATSGLCEDPSAVMDQVERAIVDEIPIEARAQEVWLMCGDGRWTTRARFELAGRTRLAEEMT